MATRLFQRYTSGVGAYTVSPAPNHYKSLVASALTTSSNGDSVVLTAGSSAFSYVLSAQFTALLPAATGTFLGSWRIFVGFQITNPTNVYTKFRVHRATLSGTALTIVATSQWSGERLTNLATQRWELSLDQVDVGTWASTDRVIIETNYRNAGASSITIQPTGGTYSNAIDTPFTTSAAFGYTNNLPAGQRVYNYSRGGIRGTSRYLAQQQYSSTSTGTATGTKGGSDFSGSVTGVSTSSGTIAAGRQGYRGTSTGSSTSSGTIAAGRQGYAGASTGSSTSSGTIAAGLQGYAGSSAGSSTSSGTVNGSPGPVPDTGGALPQWWYTEQERQPQPEPLQVLALTGAIQAKALYATGRVRGRVGYIGSASGTNRVESFITAARVGYSGSVPPSRLVADGRLSRGRVFTTNELLILIGEL
jgi:hypothetical protein